MKALAPAAALGAVLAAGCTTSDSEAEIRALLADGRGGGEARDVGFFGDVIGDAYRDTRGNDREQLLLAIRGYFIANQRIDVASRIDEVVLEGADAARAVVHAGMLGQRRREPVGRRRRRSLSFRPRARERRRRVADHRCKVG